MAKKARGLPGLARIRALLTAAERRLLDASSGAALVGATRARLQAVLAKVRTLRDKWRGLHASQTRSTKRSGGSGRNARSREKAVLFDAAVKRIETRLAEIAATGAVEVRSERPRRSKKARGVAARKTLAASGENQPLHFDASKQRTARAAATVARLKLDGQTTRRSGHAMARGRRLQARRDGRSR